MKKQQEIGRITEGEIAETFKMFGYVCFFLNGSVRGQPCDFIAVSGERTIIFDAKHCDDYIFTFDRFEPNQQMSFKYCDSLGINDDDIGFVIYCEKDNTFRWLSYSKYKEESFNKKQVDVSQLKLLVEELEI